MSSLKWFGLFLILLFAVSCSGGSATKPEDLQKLKPSSDKFELQSPALKTVRFCQRFTVVKVAKTFLL